MKEMIEAVMAKLRTEVPELRWIDLNVGQMDAENPPMENPPIEYPCALIDIVNIDYSSAGCRRQMGTVTLEIELFFVVHTSPNMTTPESIGEQALAHFNIVEKVYLAIEGLSGENFSGLNRTQAKRDKTHSPRSFILAFRCSLDDQTAVPKFTKITATPTIQTK